MNCGDRLLQIIQLICPRCASLTNTINTAPCYHRVQYFCFQVASQWPEIIAHIITPATKSPAARSWVRSSTRNGSSNSTTARPPFTLTEHENLSNTFVSGWWSCEPNGACQQSHPVILPSHRACQHYVVLIFSSTKVSWPRAISIPSRRPVRLSRFSLFASFSLPRLPFPLPGLSPFASLLFVSLSDCNANGMLIYLILSCPLFSLAVTTAVKTLTLLADRYARSRLVERFILTVAWLNAFINNT